MSKLSLISLAVAALQLSATAHSIEWPNGEKAAVSLSYDDALSSQLDNAIPSLNKYNLKGSFYLMMASPVVGDRVDEWREAAKQGHELGNHTIYHACSKSQPGTDWVAPYNDIDQRTVEQMRDEITVASAFLKAIDGKNTRTFTPPCGHLETSNGNYVETVSDLFIAIKGSETDLPQGFSKIALPDGQSGQELIDFVKKSAKNGGLVQIIFHGIGGDHIAVSREAHESLLEFLHENRETYWTDTYLNIMTHLRQQ
ncbi:polysaccharide deacetylase family protein [Gilvimarinus sp. SDUM040013]|uniref:Polysaccharide deacetylase family protein n=1 Tax=Gilvimarinus gilvus TaxID=3058038 RepID=A0ABU4RYF9_9GAMM|nr:polysaccharide deacetylase family protein [Gilvimarinus sp. SDUM040013]MDO3387966.1 polysaccharide deacetylase family protein [Gilvimarinus sp. SDUM040013]MDX6848663.1 polysaccharide deacetylase family protein [Gilvimarinus sp. SDUM040013]